MLAPVMTRCGLVNGYHSKYKKKDLTQKRTKSSLFFLFDDKGSIKFNLQLISILFPLQSFKGYCYYKTRSNSLMEILTHH